MDTIREEFIKAGFNPDSVIRWITISRNKPLQAVMQKLGNHDRSEVYRFVENNIEKINNRCLEQSRSWRQTFKEEGRKYNGFFENIEDEAKMWDSCARKEIAQAMKWYKSNVVNTSPK